jgi:hypothetical protein
MLVYPNSKFCQFQTLFPFSPLTLTGKFSPSRQTWPSNLFGKSPFAEGRLANEDGVATEGGLLQSHSCTLPAMRMSTLARGCQPMPTPKPAAASTATREEANCIFGEPTHPPPAAKRSSSLRSLHSEFMTHTRTESERVSSALVWILMNCTCLSRPAEFIWREKMRFLDWQKADYPVASSFSNWRLETVQFLGETGSLFTPRAAVWAANQYFWMMKSNRAQ